jgi:hypothetical protein
LAMSRRNSSMLSIRSLLKHISREFLAVLTSFSMFKARTVDTHVCLRKSVSLCNLMKSAVWLTGAKYWNDQCFGSWSYQSSYWLRTRRIVISHLRVAWCCVH